MWHTVKKKKKRKHTKKQENVTHSQKRKRAMESEYEKVQTSNLSYRELAGKKKKVYDKYAKGSMCEKMRDFIRELEITKENKMEML